MEKMIDKESVSFRYAITDPNQLEKWLEENSDVVGVSFIGRSNVGKSSLINALFGKKTARVSKTPGRTRAINIFSFRLRKSSSQAEESPTYYFFDLPGYGHATVSKEMSKNWNHLMSLFFEKTPSSMMMFILQDARHPNQKADQEFKKFFKKFDFESILIFNKFDKLKTQKDRAKINKTKKELGNAYLVSCEKRTGIEEVSKALVSFIDKW